MQVNLVQPKAWGRYTDRMVTITYKHRTQLIHIDFQTSILYDTVCPNFKYMYQYVYISKLSSFKITCLNTIWSLNMRLICKLFSKWFRKKRWKLLTIITAGSNILRIFWSHSLFMLARNLFLPRVIFRWRIVNTAPNSPPMSPIIMVGINIRMLTSIPLSICVNI